MNLIKRPNKDDDKIFLNRASCFKIGTYEDPPIKIQSSPFLLQPSLQNTVNTFLNN